LLVTKKRVTDLLPPIGIDDGAAFCAVPDAFPAPFWASGFWSHAVKANAAVSAQLSRSTFVNSLM
jgi:hypothetical protein